MNWYFSDELPELLTSVYRTSVMVMYAVRNTFLSIESNLIYNIFSIKRMIDS
jgi:hypothetical protein